MFWVLWQEKKNGSLGVYEEVLWVKIRFWSFLWASFLSEFRDIFAFNYTSLLESSHILTRLVVFPDVLRGLC